MHPVAPLRKFGQYAPTIIDNWSVLKWLYHEGAGSFEPYLTLPLGVLAEPAIGLVARVNQSDG
jgi:hypothetical protein